MPIHVGSRAIDLASGHVLHSEVEVIAGDGVHGVRSGMAKLAGPYRSFEPALREWLQIIVDGGELVDNA